MATNIIAATMHPETAGNGSSFDAMQNKGGDSRVLDVKAKTLLENKDPSRERGEGIFESTCFPPTVKVL